MALDLFAGHGEDDVRRTTNGTTWFAQNISGLTNNIRNISGAGANIFFSNSLDDIIEWTGAAYTRRDMAEPGFASDGIFTLPNGNAYTGHKDPGAKGGDVRKWNGSSFSSLNIPGDFGPIHGIWGTDDNNLFACGGDGAGSNRARIAQWNGSSWTITHSSASASIDEHQAIWGSSLTNVYSGGGNFLGGSGSDDLRRWNGGSWSLVTLPAGAQNITGVTGIDANNVWVCDHAGQVYYYNGGSWALQRSASGALRDIIALATNKVYAVGDSGLIAFYNGSSWANQTSGTSNQLLAVGGFLDEDPPVLQNLDPASGATGILLDDTIILEIVDVGSGVDASSVVLTVQQGSGPVETAWTGDAEQSGFSVTKTAITDGFRYEIDPDGPLESGAVITTGVNADDNVGNNLTTSYPFTTTAQQASISQTQVIAKDLLRVSFSSTVAVNSTLVDLGSWDITVLSSGASVVEIKEVRGFGSADDGVDFVDLKIIGGTLEADYQISVTGLKDTDGSLMVASGIDSTLVARFTYLKTKVDSILNSLPSMYGVNLESIIRQVLSAIAIQDEGIGGNFLILSTVPAVVVEAPEEEEFGVTWGSDNWGSKNWGGA